MSVLLSLLLAQAAAVDAPPAASQAPAVAPAQRAAAERVTAALIPPGTYKRIMRDQFPQMMDGMLGRLFGLSAASPGEPAKAGETSLGQEAVARDPHFRERTAIMTRVFAEELGTVYDEIEPEFRHGLTAAFARKFSAGQLADMDAFFRTPSGRAFATEYLTTFMDPAVMDSMMSAMPKMFKVMPAIAAKIEKATAHLPPPPARDGKTKTTGKAK